MSVVKNSVRYSSKKLPWQALPSYQQVIVALLAVLCLLVALFFSSVQDILDVWSSSETYSHCYFILPMMCYLLYNRKEHLKADAQPDFRMAFLVLPPVFIWLVGVVAEINIFIHAGLVGVLITGTLALIGWQLAKQAWPFVIFLVFLIPFGDEVVPYLVDITANFTVGTLRFLGFPIFREANHLTMSSGQWSVVEACSGVRYLMASITLGYVYALLNYNKLSKQVTFLIVSAIVPIVANGLRAVMIVLLGHYSGMTIATGVDHLIYGWLFFGVVVFVLFWAGSFWQDPELDMGFSVSDSEINGRSLLGSIGVFLALLCLMLIPVAWVKTIKFYATPPAPVFESSQSEFMINTSVGAESLKEGWSPDFLEGDQREIAEFESVSGKTFSLLLMTYGTQEGGSELVSTQNSLVRPGNKQSVLLHQREKDLELGGKILTVRQGKVRHGKSYYSISYLLLADSQPIDNFIQLKFVEARNRLINRPQPVRVLFSIDSVDDESLFEYQSDDDLREIYRLLLARLK